MRDTIIYIAVMAAVTYLIRVLPLTLIRREVHNVTIRSFLYYIPYVTLSVMTFPAILDSTGSQISGLAGLVAAVVLAWFGASLFSVAVAACVLVFVMELFIARILFLSLFPRREGRWRTRPEQGGSEKSAARSGEARLSRA